MSKPEVTELKHENMLANAIIRAKDKSVLSWWWLSIPLYLIAALLMKSFFMRHSSLVSNMREMAVRDKITSTLIFLALPVIAIIMNFIDIRKIYILSGRHRSIIFFRAIWLNLLMIAASILILIIYSL